jgi:hypothetical protein
MPGEQGARLHQALGRDAVRGGKEAAAANMDLKTAMAHTRKTMDPVFGHVFIYEHCLPFDVSRAFDEAKGIKNPRIWTAERDKEMWAALQGRMASSP